MQLTSIEFIKHEIDCKDEVNPCVYKGIPMSKSGALIIDNSKKCNFYK